MTDAERDMYAQVIQHDREYILANPPPPRKPIEPPTIHFSELPAAEPGSRCATEWNCYRREVGRLLAEGHEGRWVIIKGEEIVGIWDTEEEAYRVRIERFSNQEAIIQRICTRELVLRTPTFLLRCRN